MFEQCHDGPDCHSHNAECTPRQDHHRERSPDRGSRLLTVYCANHDEQTENDNPQNAQHRNALSHRDLPPKKESAEGRL